MKVHLMFFHTFLAIIISVYLNEYRQKRSRNHSEACRQLLVFKLKAVINNLPVKFYTECNGFSEYFPTIFFCFWTNSVRFHTIVDDCVYAEKS